MNTHVSVYEDHTHISVVGEIDLATVPTLENALASVAFTDSPRVVLDLSDVTFMDSTGIAALIRARDRALDSHGVLYLSHPHEVVVRTLAICGLTELFELAES